MLTESARVVAVENNCLWVETVRQSVCGSCAANKGCGHGLLNRIGDGRRSYLRISSQDFSAGKFRVDDQVSIAIPEELLLRSSFVVYLVPILCTLLLAAALPALIAGPNDLVAVAGAGLGFGLGVALVRLHAWVHRYDPAMQPQLLGLATPVAT